MYRSVAGFATPLSRLVLARRLARGKEHPQRLAERRGETRIARPPGPLIWAHGASVGEMLAVIPLVEGVRARNFNVLVTSGTVTSARLAEERLPPNVIHQFVPLAMATSRTHRLSNWDRKKKKKQNINKSIVRGEEIRIARHADEAALEAARVQVQEQLNVVTDRAYALARNGAG
jgi:hypothetical protein